MNPLKSVLLIVALTCAAALVLAQDRSQAQQFQEAITMMETKGNYTAAIRLFEQAAKGPDRTLAARALYYAGQCYEKSGKDKAQQAYQRLIKQFAEQRQVVAEARARLSALSPAAGNVAADKATGGMSVRQVYGGSDTSGAWMVSPDGRYLAFTDWGVGDLAIRDLVTQQIRKLTKNPPDSSEGVDVSVWSPDGKWIAYGCWWEDNNKVDRWDLRLIGVDGSGRRVLHRLDPESRNMEPYGWSPDGRNILVNISRKDRSNQIAWVTVKDGSIRVLKTVDNHGYDLDLSLSPDGRYILYNLRQSKIGERDIILLASDGSYERPLVEHPADDYVLGWLPDATKVLFASNRTSTTSAWVIAVPNGKPQGAPELVKPDIGARSSSLGITRSGSFYYKFNSGMVDVYVATLDPITGKVVTAPTQISQRFVGSNAQPSWSPDGKYLAYKYGVYTPGRYLAGFGSMLIIRSLDSGEERELLPQMNAFDIHQWSPDGRSFLTWGQDRKDHRGFYQIDAQTGAVTPLLQHEPGNSHQVPRWSPDGKELFFMIRDNTAKTQRLLRRNIETGQEQELFRTNFPASFSYVLSPDGKQIALNLSRQQLKIMPVAGGEARELLRLTEEESRQFTWTADGRHLIFDKAKVNEPTKNELWRIPIEGGAPQKLGIAMEKIGGLYMHPDGRRIVFAAGSRSKQEVWVMENFLPAAQAQKASVSRR